MVVGTQSYTVKFPAASKQFDWLEVSLVNAKSNQHKMVYDSYKAKVASATIQNVMIENTSNAYNIANELKCDKKYQL